MAVKGNQRVALTKRLLKEGFIRLAKKKSADKICISELCSESGINRATFYRHYQTPHDILIEIERDLFTEMMAEVKKPSSESDIQQCLEDTCLFLDAHSETLKILIFSNSDSFFVDILNELFEEILRDLTNIKVFKNMDPESIQIFSLYCSGGTYFVLRQWLLGNIKKTPKEIAAMVYHLLINADLKETFLEIGMVADKH